MELVSMAGILAEQFSLLEFESRSDVEYTKEQNVRDVVTKTDLEIHKTVGEFCAKEFPGTLFLSEENSVQGNSMKCITESPSVIVIDPLDGTNNLVYGLKEYGFMGCLIQKAKFIESLVLIPSENQVLTWNHTTGLRMSRDLSRLDLPSASTYLAYAPRLSSNYLNTRLQLMNLFDSSTAGVYRYGSACIGLFRTLLGIHSTFVGLQMRPWDVIPFIPILASKGASLAYSASIDEISVLISFDSHVFSRSKEIFSRNGEEVFDFNLEKSLKVTR
jgi:myo-inositol-1(or 4)-monophosphatase